MLKESEKKELAQQIYIEFKEQERSEQLLMWDRLISLVVSKEFDAPRADMFFEAQAGLLQVFGMDLIGFILDFFMDMEVESDGITSI